MHMCMYIYIFVLACYVNIYIYIYYIDAYIYICIYICIYRCPALDCELQTDKWTLVARVGFFYAVLGCLANICGGFGVCGR